MSYETLDHYSIWLETDNVRNCIFEDTILNVSRITHTPIFTPHITLVGNISSQDIRSIHEKILELSEGTHAFDVYFKNIFTGPIWLEVILLFSKKNPKLLDIHQRAKKAFGKISLFYLPHLSLSYGKTTKEAKVGAVKIIREAGILKSPFTVNHISLWHCSNGVANWKRITSARLQPALK